MVCPIEDRRFKRFAISPEDVLSLMAQPNLEPATLPYVTVDAYVARNIPIDARVVSIHCCPETRRFEITLAHSSFDSVAEGAMIGRLEPEVSRFTLPILSLPESTLKGQATGPSPPNRQS